MGPATDIDAQRSAQQIGSTVRNARKQRGLSQTQLASLAGIRQASLSQIETGTTSARLDTLLRILAALNLDLRIGTREDFDPQRFEEIF